MDESKLFVIEISREKSAHTLGEQDHLFHEEASELIPESKKVVCLTALLTASC